MKNISCCFIGHRTINITDKLINNLTVFIENLIVKQNVKNFIFGSKSEFDDICHAIVSKLKNKYKHIIRIECPCYSESPILESEKSKFENAYKIANKKTISINTCDKILDFPKKYISGYASYVERNCFMIDNSDICVFYFNKNYNPQIKSGTKVAFDYATKKSKQIFNFALL